MEREVLWRHLALNTPVGTTFELVTLSKRKSYVESIAAYNAGPSSVSKWRSLNKAPEDSWIEFIPYVETRKYVKLVLEYSLVYDVKDAAGNSTQSDVLMKSFFEVPGYVNIEYYFNISGTDLSLLYNQLQYLKINVIHKLNRVI